MTDKEDASAYLVAFLARYTQLIEGQLLNIRETMVCTVESVMKGVEGISSTTEDRRQHAEKVLESTYVNPDMETEILIQDMQKVVDEIFEEMAERHSKGQDIGQLVSAEPEVLVLNRINRFAGRFTAEMSALDTIDDELKNTIFGIIGALSSEDVISQKLEHVVMSLKILQTGLNYVLIDYNHRCTQEELAKVTSDIKNYTFRQYTAEDEKARFLSIFPPDKKQSA